MTAIILAGGASRRLGRDKASALLGGRTLLERAVLAMRQLAGDVIVVAAPGQPRPLPPELSVRLEEDLLPGRGPLAGLYTGLLAAPSPYCWAVGCDMPFLSPPLLRYLMERAPAYDAVVPLVAGRLHPLHAVYGKTALPTAEAMLAGGGGSLHGLLERLHVLHVGETEGARSAEWRRSCFNINTPEDWAQAEAIDKAGRTD